MNLVAIMPVRNEAHELGLTARALLMWCDQLILGNHASTDRTGEIIHELLREFPDRVLFTGFEEHEWNEMEHRQMLLHFARERGPSHIVFVDADEVLTGSLLPYIRDLIAAMPKDLIFELPWFQMRDSIWKFHVDGVWGNRFVTMAVKDDPRWQWQVDGVGYQHHHRHPQGIPYKPHRPVPHNQGGLLHLQMVDPTRLRAKQLLYCLNDLVRWPKRKTPEEVRAYYSWAVYGSCPKPGTPVPAPLLRGIPKDWWAPYGDLMQYYHPTDEPWQLEECRRIVKENPGILKGLDTFGLAVK